MWLLFIFTWQINNCVGVIEWSVFCFVTLKLVGVGCGLVGGERKQI